MPDPEPTPEEIKRMLDSLRRTRAGLQKPGGITIFLTRGKKRIRKSWRSFDVMITEQVIDESGKKVEVLAQYPGECYWSKTKKEWKFRRKT